MHAICYINKSLAIVTYSSHKEICLVLTSAAIGARYMCHGDELAVTAADT